MRCVRTLCRVHSYTDTQTHGARKSLGKKKNSFFFAIATESLSVPTNRA